MSVTDPPWSSPRRSIKFKQKNVFKQLPSHTEPRFSEELPVVSMLTGSKQYIEGYPLDAWILIVEFVPDVVYVCNYCGKSYFSEYKCCHESQNPYVTQWCSEIYFLNRDCRHCTFGDTSNYCTCHLVNDCVKCKRCQRRLSLSTFTKQYCGEPCSPSP